MYLGKIFVFDFKSLAVKAGWGWEAAVGKKKTLVM